MTAEEQRQFEMYLQNCSDAQLQGVFEKERAAGRQEEVKLVRQEARARGICLRH